MRTLVTVTMVLDWPENALHELAAALDKGVRDSMTASVAPVAMKHGLSSEEVDSIISDAIEFYGVSLMPRQELSVSNTGTKP